MLWHFLLTIFTLFVLFILFLVISKTLNNVVNLLLKIEYLLQKEIDLKNEALEVHMIMQEQSRNQKELVTLMRNKEKANEKQSR